METTLDKLKAMAVYTDEDIIFSNGIVQTTKTISKVGDNAYEVHSFTCGWTTAKMTEYECVGYIEGKLDFMDFVWE